MKLARQNRLRINISRVTSQNYDFMGIKRLKSLRMAKNLYKYSMREICVVERVRLGPRTSLIGISDPTSFVTRRNALKNRLNNYNFLVFTSTL